MLIFLGFDLHNTVPNLEEGHSQLYFPHFLTGTYSINPKSWPQQDLNSTFKGLKLKSYSVVLLYFDLLYSGLCIYNRGSQGVEVTAGKMKSEKQLV